MNIPQLFSCLKKKMEQGFSLKYLYKVKSKVDYLLF